MQYKASRLKQLAVVPGFCCADDAVLGEFSTDQIRQVLWAYMQASAHASKIGRIKDLGTFLLPDRMVAVTLANGVRFLQISLDLNCRKMESPFMNMTTSTGFEVIILLVLIIGFQRRATEREADDDPRIPRRDADRLLCAAFAQYLKGAA